VGIVVDNCLAKEQGVEQSIGFGGCLVTCKVDELRSHPSYIRHRLAVSASQISALAGRSDQAFQEPLAITRDRTVLDGYARWDLARQQGRLILSCIEYDLSEMEALQWILRTHQRSKGLNDFNRIVLALDLESLFQEKARLNQRIGGQYKGSSNLTEAERLDVRSEIAAAAGVSVGNVSKVKHLKLAARPELEEALRHGEVSIHRAWIWSKGNREEQRERGCGSFGLRKASTMRSTNSYRDIVQRTFRFLLIWLTSLRGFPRFDPIN
jgi:hypothetical protein